MDFSTGWLSTYFTHKLAAPQPVEIADITRFGRGSSRETWFLKYHDPGDHAKVVSVVMRIDFPGGSTDPSSLYQEYFIYDRLGRTDVPIARAFWWEDDPLWSNAGRPFYVREHIDGSWEVPHFNDPDPCYDELRIDVSREHLRKLALVHAVDWKSLGFDTILKAPRDQADCAHNAIDVIMQRFDEIRSEALPIVLEAAEWLHAHAPVASRISLCKGTNGLGEEIFRGREIVAMSDWEEASIGDPAADFAFMQNFVPEIERDGVNLWGLDKGLDYYASVSGTRVSADNVRFYQVLRALKMALYSHNAAVAVSRHANAQIKQVWTGTEIMHLAKHILAAAMGMMEPISPSLFVELNVSIGEK